MTLEVSKMKVLEGVLAIVALIVGVVVVVSVLVAVPVMLLWNYLCPTLFHLPEITFFQAMALSLLCSLLFKSTNLNNKK